MISICLDLHTNTALQYKNMNNDAEHIVEFKGKESWKQIDVLNHQLLVSTKGRVAYIDANNETILLKQYIGYKGYAYVVLLYTNEELNMNNVEMPYDVHRLVIKAHDPINEDKANVHHIDGNKLNNSISNLIAINRNQHKAIHQQQLSAENEGRRILANCVKALRDINNMNDNQIAKLLDVKYGLVHRIKTNNMLDEIEYPSTQVAMMPIKILPYRYDDIDEANVLENVESNENQAITSEDTPQQGIF